ncbi:MAG TPA: PQQ-binding-like beta-propeller repeat protein, partial [Armatimonadota bacterium]|nr:PQQ-binding-like beta-propeller repeat protein [Armatimonadota bacterium]
AAGDTLLAETWRGRLLALNPADGSLRWQRAPGQVHGLALDDRRLYLRLSVGQDEGWSIAALDRATGDLAWELRARRMVPDLTLIGDVLIAEFKTQVIALRVS